MRLAKRELRFDNYFYQTASTPQEMPKVVIHESPEEQVEPAPVRTEAEHELVSINIAQ